MSVGPDIRERTHQWADPAATAAAATRTDGLTFVRAMASGEVPPPPMATLLGMSVAEVEPGRVVFALEPAEFHFNPIGSVHGGVYATLLDSALGAPCTPRCRSGPATPASTCR